MERICDKCGEVLFGAVNRCWRCGNQLQVVVSTPKVPPIRRSPIDLSLATVSVPVSEQQPLPFPFSISLSNVARYRCSIVSGVLGTIGCLIGITTGWALFCGVVGLGFGLVGMQTKKRDLATMGLVLSVVAIFIGFAQIGFDVWTRFESQRWINELQGGVVE